MDLLSPSLTSPWRIGVDVGGTFTDMVLRDAAGAVRIFKAPSVPADPSEGVLGVLRLAAQQLDLPLTAAAARLRAVRARLDRRHQHHPREEGRQGRHADHRGLPRFARDPPRHAREPVGPSRALPRGAGAALPAPAGARPHRRRRQRAGAARRRRTSPRPPRTFAAEGVESVAVCLFNSFLDGAHERAAGAELARHGVGQWVSLSSEVMPTMGEYERGSTAVVNAYIAPKVTELPAGARPPAAPARPAALAAAAAEQRRRGLGRPGRGAAGDAGAVGPGRRRRRAQGLRRRRARRPT